MPPEFSFKTKKDAVQKPIMACERRLCLVEFKIWAHHS